MRTPILLLLLLPLAATGACGGRPAAPAPPMDPLVATFSIVARDPATGDLGVAVQSKFFGVGVVVPYVRADVGAIATQALAEPTYGTYGLAALDRGEAAEDVIRSLTYADPGRARRQVGIVDSEGGAAAFTGKQTTGWAGHVVGKGYCCQGNILTGTDVIQAMAGTFESTRGPLAERLLAALRAGQAAGGDKRGRQSAALLVARRNGGYRGRNDRYIDLRVDDHKRPIQELARLLALRRKFTRDAAVPERVKGLVREPSTGTPETARGACSRRRARSLGAGADVGTRYNGDRAVVFLAQPGQAKLERIQLSRAGGTWRIDP